MQELRVFYLPGCPYCKKALAILEEMRKEAQYVNLVIFYVNEQESPSVADLYDYWNVPAFFSGSKKLYECKPGHSDAQIRAGVRESMEAAIAVR